eukprot:jgi/Mesvir1/19098/Mv12847-RA.4
MVILWPLLLLLMHAVHGFDNSYDRRDHSAKGRQLQEVRDLHAPGAKDPTKIKLISWSPRAYLYSGFLTPEECDHIMALAKPAMKKSQVVDNETGKSKDSNIRTSSGTFLRRGQDAIIEAIERRVADYSMIPPENGEGMQVLHYELGQKYDAHFDYFHDPVNIRNGGQRIATVLMYLTDVEAGGETVFPNTKSNRGRATRCCSGRWTHPPRRTRAVYTAAAPSSLGTSGRPPSGFTKESSSRGAEMTPSRHSTTRTYSGSGVPAPRRHPVSGHLCVEAMRPQTSPVSTRVRTAPSGHPRASATRTRST